MEIAYVVHSARCALLLDDDGVCRWFVTKDDDESVATSAKRCIGAQFVASLDPDAPGMLGQKPRVGTNLLFARVDAGRISLVRFGPLVQLDTADAWTPADAAVIASTPSVRSTPSLRSTPSVDSTPSVHAAPSVASAPSAPAVPLDRESDTTLRRVVDDAFEDFDDLSTAVASVSRPSGFAIRPHLVLAPEDAVENPTELFTREPRSDAAPAERRGVLPRRRSR